MASRALEAGVPGQPSRDPEGGLRAHQGRTGASVGRQGVATSSAQKKTDYSGTPLYRKLGIREECLALLVSAPPGFRKLLGQLPEGAEIVEASSDPVDVIILFTTAGQDLNDRFAELSEIVTPAGGLWVAWPKKSSRIDNDLSFEVVQEIGLAAGLVDNKSCAIDEDWQGLRFVHRKKDRK